MEHQRQSGSSQGATQSSSGSQQNDDDTPKESSFDCNICLDPAKDAVVSVCGHLFW